MVHPGRTNARRDLDRLERSQTDRRRHARIRPGLGDHPLDIGESRSSSVHRLAFHSPLGIEYTVIEDDKRVTVMAVFAGN